MSILRGILGGIADLLTPDGTLLRMRFRGSFDMLVTLGVTAVAIALAVGYQVMRLLGRRPGPAS